VAGAKVCWFGVFSRAIRRYASDRRLLAGDLIIVGFLVTQVLDGAFTYLGVHSFGRHIEANPLLVWLMTCLGDGPALAAAKATAIAFGAFLHLTAVHRAVAALTALYLAFAIVPWTRLRFF
jgi:hypothetical protein